MLVHSVSIIIVSYNSEDFIDKCIKSVLKFLPNNGEIIVVDNSSSDGTVARVKSLESRIKIVENGENLGFSKANNIGAREASGEYLFFLNPDTEVLPGHSDPPAGGEGSLTNVRNYPNKLGDSSLITRNDNFFDQLINFYEKTPDVGIVAPKLVLPNGETQPSVRKIPSIAGAFQEYILGQKNAYSQFVPESDQPLEVEMVYGAAMLIKKDLFEKLKGFDEKYFLYYEDIDLCKRVRELGKKVYYYPVLQIKHLVGATKSSQNRNNLNEQSAKKYHGLIEFYFLQFIFLISRVIKKF